MPFLFSKTFDDLDQLIMTAQHWNIDFLQLSAGRFFGQYEVVPLGPLMINHARCNQILRQQGQAPKGCRTFAILTCDSIEQKWLGRRISGTDVMLCPQSGEFESVTPPEFDVFTVSVPHVELERALKRLDRPDLGRIIKSQEIIPCASQSIARPRLLLSRIFKQSLGMGLQEYDLEYGQILADQLVDCLLLSLANSGPCKKPPAASKCDRAIRLAEEYIRQNGAEPIRVGHLSQVAGVSKRTLQYAFKERFGVSPLYYLKAYRLKQVRKELRQADSNTSKVGDLANQWGFGHLGQFAADYKRHFGELPSYTLASN